MRGPTQGSPPSAGSRVVYGTGAPAAGTGSDGDSYVDTTNNRLYGPKASGAWPGSFIALGGGNGGTVTIDTTAPATVNPGDLHVRTDAGGNPIGLFTAAGPFAGTVVVAQTAPGASIAADSLYVQTDANGVVTNLYAGAA